MRQITFGNRFSEPAGNLRLPVDPDERIAAAKSHEGRREIMDAIAPEPSARCRGRGARRLDGPNDDGASDETRLDPTSRESDR